MHVVTKILLVFCAVLSLLLAALTMAYAANAGEIRNGYRDMEQQKLAANAARDDLQSQWAQREAVLEEKWKTVNDGLVRFQKENSDLQAQRTELRTQLEQAKAQAEAAANRIVEATGTAATQADVIKVYREEVTKLRDDMVKYARRESELVDKINDLESQREVIVQNTRALQEQLKELQGQLQARTTGEGVGKTDQPFEHPGPPIYARVLDVFPNPAGEQMVTISEGSNKNIKPNMLMNIVRGDKFLAKVVITTVDPNKCVGRVDKLGQKLDIKVDDQVLSTLIK